MNGAVVVGGVGQDHEAVVDQVLAVAGEQAAALDWSRIRAATIERRGYPIRITR